MNYLEGISIFVTAYKTQNYIEECLDSIKNQTWFKEHDNYEILLGIDGCEETLAKVKEIMHKYRNLRVFMMEKNCGTYVTSNTLITLAKYDKLLRFDSDDIMLPNLVERVIEYQKFDEVNFKMKNFGGRSNIEGDCGHFMIKHNIIDEYGGYMPWSCSADSEFHERVGKFLNIKNIDEVLVNRRIHKTNLTVSKETNFSSLVRRWNNLYVATHSKINKNKENAKIITRVGNCQEIIDGKNIPVVFNVEHKKIEIKNEFTNEENRNTILSRTVLDRINKMKEKQKNIKITNKK